LHESLGVLLQAAPGVQLSSCATRVAELISTPTDAPLDVVLVYDCGTGLPSAVGAIRAAWPGACTIVLVKHSRQVDAARAAGADEILLEGLAPARLLETLDRVCVDGQ
jgi:hypothetical protein